MNPNNTDNTIPITNPNDLTAPRIEFQRKRYLEKHRGLISSINKHMDELLHIVERIQSNDIQQCDYSVLSDCLMSSLWLGREAHSLDAVANLIRSIDNKK